jgi:hypothetical protein
MIFGGAGTRIERNEFVGGDFGTDDDLAALDNPKRLVSASKTAMRATPT